MKIEGPKFRLWFAPDISPDEFNEAASAICKVLIDPPQSPRHRRAVAVRQCLAVYSGARSNRAKTLESRFRLYLAGAWPREQALEVLPEPRSTERVLLHRLARCNGGRPLCWRQIIRVADRCDGHGGFDHNRLEGFASGHLDRWAGAGFR